MGESNDVVVEGRGDDQWIQVVAIDVEDSEVKRIRYLYV